MVHQRTRPPPQAAGRGGYRGVNQTTKCLNCGFGRGQFGVEFCEDYCSLDCYTSAKVTGRNLTRDSRCNRNTDVQAAPWPRGLLVEAPPAPKPWRGRTWSSDNITWRAGTTSTCNSNFSADESSSIESVADWSGGVGGDVGVGGGDDRGGGGVRGGGGDGAGCGLRFGVAGGASNTVATAAKRNSPSRTIISGGGAASSNGVSGGRSAEEGGCSDEAASGSSGDATRSGCCGEGVPDEGSQMQRRDAAINCLGRDASGNGRVDLGDGDNNGGVGGGGTVNILRRDLPPLAPVPRTGAFRQQHRRVQSAVDTRTVAFAPTPPQATPQATPNPPAQNAGAGVRKPHSFLPAAGGQIQAELCGVTMVGVLGGVTAVGVTPVTPLGDASSSSRGAGSECGGGDGEPGPGGGGGTAGARLGGKGLEDLEGGRGNSSGVSGTGTGASAAAVGREGGAGGGGVCKNATGVDGAAAVESTAVIGQAADSTAVIGQEAKSTAVIGQEAVVTAVTGQAADSTAVIGQKAEGSGERVPSMDAMMIGTRCGASAGAGTGVVAEGEDVEVMKSIMSCETVRTYPTTAAIRQWRHMFLP